MGNPPSSLDFDNEDGSLACGIDLSEIKDLYEIDQDDSTDEEFKDLMEEDLEDAMEGLPVKQEDNPSPSPSPFPHSKRYLGPTLLGSGFTNFAMIFQSIRLHNNVTS